MLPASPPGEIIQIALDNNGLTCTQLIDRTGMQRSCVEGMLASEHPITPKAAEKIAEFFGTSKELWLGLQYDYDQEHPQQREATTCNVC